MSFGTNLNTDFMNSSYLREVANNNLSEKSGFTQQKQNFQTRNKEIKH